jgi:hypothetical protein
MKFTIATTTLLAMAATVSSVPARAEEQKTQTQMETGAVAGSAEADTGTTASTKTEPDFESLVSSIQASKDRMNTVQTMTSVSSVNVVDVRDMAQGEKKATLENTLAESQSEITGLQAAVIANPALAAKLKEQTVDPSNVVAVTIEADGSVTVFVQ